MNDDDDGHASPSGVDEVIPEGAIIASLERSQRLQHRFDKLTVEEDATAEALEKPGADARRKRLAREKASRPLLKSAKSWKEKPKEKGKKNSNLPPGSFYKHYNRLGIYELKTVLDARRVFKEFDTRAGTG